MNASFLFFLVMATTGATSLTLTVIDVLSESRTEQPPQVQVEAQPRKITPIGYTD